MAGSETQRVERMIDGLVGLRRVRQLLPGNVDVDRALTGLEEALGGAVSQRVAARALGIPHPELSKLIAQKKLETTNTSRGKNQVEIRSLIDMIEAKESAERGGSKREAKEEKAPGDSRSISDIMVARALAYHRALARNLDRPMIDRASEIVDEWAESGKLNDDQATEWRRVLGLPFDDIASAMIEFGEAGNERRRVSPFEALGRRADD